MPKSNHSSACKIAQETRWDTIVYGWMRVDPCTTYPVHCAEDVLRASEPREGLLGCLRVVVEAIRRPAISASSGFTCCLQ